MTVGGALKKEEIDVYPDLQITAPVSADRLFTLNIALVTFSALEYLSSGDTNEESWTKNWFNNNSETMRSNTLPGQNEGPDQNSFDQL